MKLKLLNEIKELWFMVKSILIVSGILFWVMVIIWKTQHVM